MKLVIAGRFDRLGARLKNMLCAWRFARRAEGSTIVLWNHVNHVTGDPSSYDPGTIFDLDTIDHFNDLKLFENIDAVNQLYGWRIDVDAQFSTRRKSDDSIILQAMRDDFIIVYLETRQIVWPNDSPAQHEADMRALFRELPLNRAVSDAINAVTDRIAINEAIAVHIRRGDIISNLFLPIEKFVDNNVAVNFAARYVPLDGYISAIEALGPARPLVCFSDDPQIKIIFGDRYRHKLLFIDSVLDEFDLSELQRSFVEFVLISRCNTVLGGGSQFCRLAAILGGIPIVDPMSYSSALSVMADIDKFLEEAKYDDERHTMLFSACSSVFRRLGMKEESDMFKGMATKT